MPDTTFYIHRQDGRVPAAVVALAASRPVLHCGVALGELAITAGLLDPAHPGTDDVRAKLMRVLAGILARAQLGLAHAKRDLSPDAECCQRGRRREVLNDALLFLTAIEAGAVLLSANVADMDVLLRFRPDARVLLYRALPRGAVP